jgi:hypothetical protein
MVHSGNFKNIYNKSILINKVSPKSPFFWPTVAANKEEENFRPKLLDSGKNEDLSRFSATLNLVEFLLVF